MGQNLWDSLDAASEEEKRRWYQARNAAVAKAQQLYERGRQAYADAVRTGQDVVARTPAEVRALGGAVNAGVRSAGNAISLGAADNLEAATEAAVGMGGAGGFGQRYQRQLSLQHQADAEAAREHPDVYKWAGRAGAVGGVLAASEPRLAEIALSWLPEVSDALKAIRTAKRIGFVQEGLPTMAAVGGGAVGGVTQVASDAAHGRLTSPKDLAGAVGGGAIGGLAAIRGGAALGAGVGGGATGLLQGEDVDHALSDADASAYLGRVIGTAGGLWANALPKEVKGPLGEWLSFGKSWARGEPIAFPAEEDATVGNILPEAKKLGPQQLIKLPDGSRTRADWITDWGRAIESKFGNTADFTVNQKKAIPALGDRYLPDHWLPRDIGDFSGSWLGSPLGPALTDGSAW